VVTVACRSPKESTGKRLWHCRDCCIDGEWVRLIGVVPRSDSEGEFGASGAPDSTFVVDHPRGTLRATTVCEAATARRFSSP
jgi:hypothetical protein